MSKLISFAGVSRVNGVLKFRGAQSPARITQLRKLGDTDVEMCFLNTEMTKSEAAKRLIATNFANGREDILALLVGVANDDNPFKKTARVVKLKVPSVAMQKLVGAEIEEEPMTRKEAARLRAEWNRAHAHLSYDGE
jgi:hypothetical protein